MLFNSHVFIFVFLPIALLGFVQLARRGWHRPAIAWMVICSFVFYGWWDPRYILLFSASILFNYTVGVNLGRQAKTSRGRALVALGVAGDLALLGYFKYTRFFMENLNSMGGFSLTIPQIVLPLGISFFTFTQIAYLVDAYRGVTREYSLLHYVLFVSFFPHLIAGPIIHHKDVIPQFDQKAWRWDAGNFATGLSYFIFGLYKKVVFADGVSIFSSPIFAAAAQGVQPGFYQAWGGALAYTLQIYFDFSGYSDMAIGLAWMFGIRFPLNFNSPYKAASMIDFWRRWHMTLSRFLRDYLYISLGGNRRGEARRYVNIFLTMLLGGLWHGAGWTFVIWGALHGFFIVINHAWRDLRKRLGHNLENATMMGKFFSWAVTFLAVIVCWVFFRAANAPAAGKILRGMMNLKAAGHNPLAILGAREIAWLAGLLAVVWLLPNTQELMARFSPVLDGPAEKEIKSLVGPRWRWQPSAVWACFLAAAFVVSVLHLSHVTEFLYFQF